MRSNWSRVAVLAVVGCMSVVACGDDDDSTSNTGGTSGSKNAAGEGGDGGKTGGGGKSGGTGGKTGGTAGSSTAGKTNSGGEGGSGVTGGTGPIEGGAGGAMGGAGGVDMGGAGGDAPVPEPYCAPGSDFGSGGEGGGFGADACYVQKNYGDICTPYSGVLRGQAGALDWYGELESGSNIDELRVQLYPDLGPFGAELTTGTYQLTGDDLNYETCGICVLLFENSVGDSARGTYFATGGTVKITQVEPRLVATITNLTMEHVTIDDQTYHSTPVGDSCSTKFGTVEIDAPVPPQ